MGQIKKRLVVAAAGAWLALPGSATAQPRAATLDDVLAMSTFGGASFSPDGRWLAVETQGAYDSAPRFDLGVRSGWATTQLQAAEVSTGVLKPLIPAEPGWGYLLGPWSPTGARLVVYRLGAARFEAGVVDMASRSVVWTGLAPDWPSSGQGAVWLDDDRLAVTVRTDGELPLRLRFDATGEGVIRARWATSRKGRTPSRLKLETRDGGVVADEPAAPKRLMLLSAPFTHAQPLLDGAIRDIEASPDGRTLAVLRMGEVAPQPPAAPVGQSAILNRTRLSFVETASGRITTPDPEADIAPHLLRWSPDSRRVLVWRRLEGDRWRDGRLSAVGPDGDARMFDTRGLDPAAAGADLDELRPVRADWFGDRPLLYARKGGRWDWWLATAEEPRPLTRDLAAPPGRLAALSEGGLLLFADHRLWAVNAAGQAFAVDRETDLAPAEQADALTTLRLRLNAPPRRDWAAARRAETLVVLDRGGERLWSASAPCAGWRKTVAATGQAIAFICGEQGVETLWLARPGGVRAVTRMNPGFADLALADPRPVDYRDARGSPVRSWLFLPPGVSRAEIEGVIVLVYPGALPRRTSASSGLRHLGSGTCSTIGPRARAGRNCRPLFDRDRDHQRLHPGSLTQLPSVHGISQSGFTRPVGDSARDGLGPRPQIAIRLASLARLRAGQDPGDNARAHRDLDVANTDPVDDGLGFRDRHVRQSIDPRVGSDLDQTGSSVDIVAGCGLHCVQGVIQFVRRHAVSL